LIEALRRACRPVVLTVALADATFLATLSIYWFTREPAPHWAMGLFIVTMSGMTFLSAWWIGWITAFVMAGFRAQQFMPRHPKSASATA